MRKPPPWVDLLHPTRSATTSAWSNCTPRVRNTSRVQPLAPAKRRWPTDQASDRNRDLRRVAGGDLAAGAARGSLRSRLARPGASGDAAAARGRSPAGRHRRAAHRRRVGGRRSDHAALALGGFATSNWVLVVSALAVGAAIAASGLLYRMALWVVAGSRGGYTRQVIGLGAARMASRGTQRHQSGGPGRASRHRADRRTG